MSDWTLHPRLAHDSLAIATWPLSELRLINDRRWPWLVLIPRVSEAAEWLDLDNAQRQQLDGEIQCAGKALRSAFPTDRINIAALGNVVAQFHVHVVSRHAGDAGWPGPVWGCGLPEPYDDAGLTQRLATLSEHLAVPA